MLLLERLLEYLHLDGVLIAVGVANARQVVVVEDRRDVLDGLVNREF